MKKRIEEEDLEAMKAEAEEKQKNIKVDETTTGVTEHKGSKWESNWKNFKEQNPLVQSKCCLFSSISDFFSSMNIFCNTLA